jgi:hypothetical protein
VLGAVENFGKEREVCGGELGGGRVRVVGLRGWVRAVWGCVGACSRVCVGGCVAACAWGGGGLAQWRTTRICATGVYDFGQHSGTTHVVRHCYVT